LPGSNAVVGRLGGDEFAVLMCAPPAECETCAQALVAASFDPFPIASHSIYVGVSIGAAALAPGSGAHEMMRRADIALYTSKRSGKSCYRTYSSDMDVELFHKRLIEAELRTALKQPHGLVVYYQPQISTATRQVTGYEALVRWQHPRLGFISPADFVPIAEECGLINSLDMWVLEEACRTALSWAADTFVAVNISSTAFRQPGLAARALFAAKECGIAPSRVQLEITETALLKLDTIASAEIVALRTAGFTVALDDFGTGYSSLSHLQRLAVDKIKIDKSFVQEIYMPEAVAIISAVVTLGRSMGVEITAEGVETEDQAAFLSAAGCTTLQGYLYGKPMPAGMLREAERSLAPPQRPRLARQGVS
jgi:predicted signal transduction protein with EAL and GGDEF domain